MKISIVTPSYNQGQFVRETIESVLAQDVPDLEYMVLDGGSTDNSADIIREYEPRLTYWHSKSDRGQADAIHKGFEMSTGDILGWVNSDDMLKPGALSFVMDIFKHNPEIHFMYGGCEIIDEQGRHIKNLLEPCYNEKWQLYIRCCVPQSSCFWRRALYFETGGLDTSLHYAMDYDLWFKFYNKAKPHIAKKILSSQRMYAETKTLSEPGILEEEKERVRQRYFKLPPYRIRWIFKILWRIQRIMRKTFAGCYFDS